MKNKVNESWPHRQIENQSQKVLHELRKTQETNILYWMITDTVISIGGDGMLCLPFTSKENQLDKVRFSVHTGHLGILHRLSWFWAGSIGDQSY